MSAAAAFPRRYRAVRQLGKGGSGEVWEVEDRASGQALALKVLARNADRSEILSLVREASALTGLEGLGLPRVLRYGVLSSGQTFIVRELVVGKSLRELLEAREVDARALVRALVDTSAQLAEIHRAGLLHGDLKPGNIVVDPSGRGLLVDLGLSAPFLDAGTAALGLTPDYAAPELMSGKRVLTVRSEIYSLGATLAEILRAMPAGPEHDALLTVAARAMRHAPDERYPSVDELARAMAAALGLDERPALGRLWPVIGIEDVSRRLVDAAHALQPQQTLRLVGPPGSGRSTLLRRLAWSLGASGAPVAWLERATPTWIDLELDEDLPEDAFVLVDDADDAETLATIEQRAPRARKIYVHSTPMGAGDFEIPALDAASAERLLHLAQPSLPEAARREILRRSEARPGPLHAIAERLASYAVVSLEELDALLDGHASDGPISLEQLEAALARGRFGEAQRIAEQLPAEGFAVHAGWIRIATAIGDFERAERALAEARALATPGAETWITEVLGARLALRRGDSDAARERAERTARAIDEALRAHDTPDVTNAKAAAKAPNKTKAATNDPNATADTTRDMLADLAADALAVVGIASVLLGDFTRAHSTLQRAIASARGARAKAIAAGSIAIAHERSGDDDAAKRAYADALTWAERAGDAWTASTTHSNFAGLLRKLGDLAGAARSLEAGIDMGLRAGATLLVDLSRLNLLGLALHLGRYARAEELAATLRRREDQLSAVSRAQLLGLSAELHERKGEFDAALTTYAACESAYRALGRSADAAEVALTALLVRVRVNPTSAQDLISVHHTLVTAERPAWFDEHEGLSRWVLGELEMEAGHELEARRALDRAVELAEQHKQAEIEWQAREARARLFDAQGSRGLAQKDRSAALAILEQSASTLPRDLREVFWNDPRRRQLRARAHTRDDTWSIAVHSPTLALGASTISRAQLESSRHFAASLSADDRLLRVLAITRELARERDLDRVLSLVVEHAIGLARAERAAILLRAENEDGSARLDLHTSQHARGVDGDTRAFSRSIAEVAMAQGSPVVTDSAKSDPRFGSAQSVQLHALQHIVCLPIHGPPPANQPIGALYLESNRAEPHDELELATLTAFADQAAIAIDNARMWTLAAQSSSLLEKKSVELERAKNRLAEVLERRTEQLHTARKDLRRARADIEAHFGYQGLVGTSAAMRRVYSFIEQVKDTDIPVLILGESGTGKEVVARAIHQASARAKSPFIGINCGAIPANLLESELFGHVRGAFTGADRERTGLLRDAKDGTVLLDEIGEMPLAMQAGLLRVLQEKLVRPLGGTSELPVSARIIAATNRDLEQMVQERSFREDLYYRIHVATVVLPALRERREDIPMLIDHLLTRFATRYRRDKKPVDRDAMRALVEHPWPGNVRQLEHVLLSAWLMGDKDEIVREDLALSSARGFSSGKDSSHSRPAPRATNGDDERERIVRALAKEGGNRVRAAEALNMPRRTFYRRLKQYGLLD